MSVHVRALSSRARYAGACVYPRARAKSPTSEVPAALLAHHVVLLLAGSGTCAGAAQAALTQGGVVSAGGTFSVTLGSAGVYALCHSTMASPTLDLPLPMSPTR